MAVFSIIVFSWFLFFAPATLGNVAYGFFPLDYVLQNISFYLKIVDENSDGH